MKKNIKKILKVLGIFLLIILVALIAYLIYLFASYHRIPDNQALKIEEPTRRTSASLWTAENLPGQKVRRVSNLIFRVPENWLLPKIRISH